MEPTSLIFPKALHFKKSRGHRSQFTAVFLILSAGSLLGNDLLRWDITGTTGVTGSGIASAPAPGVSGSVLTAGGATGNSTSPSNTWNRSFTLQSDFDAAVTEGNFFSFTTTAAEGYTVSISGITGMNLVRTSSGATAAGLFFSTDNATFTQTGTTFTVTQTLASAASAFSQTMATTPIVISGGATVHWRLVVYGGANTARFGIGNGGAIDVAFTGTSVSDVPARNLLWTGTGGDVWDTDITNTNWADTDSANAPTYFSTFDNASINSPTAIAVDLAGISAGTLSIDSSAGDISLASGPLSALSLTKVGVGTLTLSGANSFSGGSTVNAGTVLVDNNLALGTTGITLNGATLQASSNTTLLSNTIALGNSGGTISNADDLSLDKVTNTILNNPLTKSGAGTLTLTNGLGTQNTGPVELKILAGGVTLTGTGQINVGKTNTIDGTLTLNGPVLMLHNSTVSGSGLINVTTATSSLISRFNLGRVDIDVPITLSGDFNVSSPNGGNNLYLNRTISGAFNLIKNGNGVVELTDTNSYVDTTISAGTLRLGTGGSLGSGDVTIATGTTLQFNQTNEITVGNNLSGDGDVRMNGSGSNAIVTLTGTNTYTGVTTVSSGGAINAPNLTNGSEPGSIGAAPADADKLVLNGGTLAHTGPETTCDRPFTVGVFGGTLAANGSGPLTMSDTGSITLTDPEVTTVRDFRLSGIGTGTNVLAATITDAENAQTTLRKNGPNTWSLTAVNTYTGFTRVNEGTLRISQPYLADSSEIRINATAILDLNFDETHGDVTDVVDTLMIEDVEQGPGVYVQQPAGVYGATGSGATIINDINFAGVGTLTVLNGPIAETYADWAQANGIGTAAFNDDFDNDGIPNGMEYALGKSPTVSSQPAGVLAANKITFTKGAEAITNADVSWIIEISETLAAESWTPVVTQVAGNTDPTIEYTFTPGSPAKEFARLKVVQVD